MADEKKPDEVEKFISAADSQSAVSAQSDGSEDTESVQTGGNEYQPLEDGLCDPAEGCIIQRYRL